MDLSKKGLDMFFKDYQVESLRYLWSNHPEGTIDDRFWAVALGNYAVEMEPVPASRPMGRTA